VIDSVRAGRTSGTAQLAAWQFTPGGWFRETLYFPGALLMLGGALLVGVLAALPADRREENRIAIAMSGVVGPLLVAAAYFLSAPNLTVRTGQLSAYLFAPYAVIAGLAGSALVAAFTPLRPKKPGPVPAEIPEPAPTADADAEQTRPPRPVPSTSDKAEQTVRLDAKKPDVPAVAPASAPAPTVTGRATVAQPLWPGRPRPRRKQRDA
jgi:hypothetical protein